MRRVASATVVEMVEEEKADTERGRRCPEQCRFILALIASPLEREGKPSTPNFKKKQLEEKSPKS
jgi:hypothetical protein